MRLEVRALLVDGASSSQAENLIAAAVGEDGARPADKPMKASAPRDGVAAGAQIQMIRVRQEDLRPKSLQITMGDPLHRTLSTDRQKRRRLDLAVRRHQEAATSAAVDVGNAEIERHAHVASVFDRTLEFTIQKRTTADTADN